MSTPRWAIVARQRSCLGATSTVWGLRDLGLAPPPVPLPARTRGEGTWRRRRGEGTWRGRGARGLEPGESPVLGKVAVESDGIGDVQALHDHEAHSIAKRGGAACSKARRAR